MVFTAPLAPNITSAKVVGGRFTMSFTGASAGAYSAYATTDLAPANWTNLGPVTPVGGGVFQFTDPEPLAYTHRFYQVRGP